MLRSRQKMEGSAGRPSDEASTGLAGSAEPSVAVTDLSYTVTVLQPERLTSLGSSASPSQRTAMVECAHLEIPSKPFRYLLLDEGLFWIRLTSSSSSPIIAKLEVDRLLMKSNFRLSPHGTHTIKATRGSSGMSSVPLAFHPSNEQRKPFRSLEDVDKQCGTLRLLFFEVGHITEQKWEVKSKDPFGVVVLRYGFAPPFREYFGLPSLPSLPPHSQSHYTPLEEEEIGRHQLDDNREPVVASSQSWQPQSSNEAHSPPRRIEIFHSRGDSPQPTPEKNAVRGHGYQESKNGTKRTGELVQQPLLGGGSSPPQRPSTSSITAPGSRRIVIFDSPPHENDRLVNGADNSRIQPPKSEPMPTKTTSTVSKTLELQKKYEQQPGADANAEPQQPVPVITEASLVAIAEQMCPGCSELFMATAFRLLHERDKLQSLLPAAAPRTSAGEKKGASQVVGSTEGGKSGPGGGLGRKPGGWFPVPATGAAASSSNQQKPRPISPRTAGAAQTGQVRSRTHTPPSAPTSARGTAPSSTALLNAFQRQPATTATQLKRPIPQTQAVKSRYLTPTACSDGKTKMNAVVPSTSAPRRVASAPSRDVKAPSARSTPRGGAAGPPSGTASAAKTESGTAVAAGPVRSEHLGAAEAGFEFKHLSEDETLKRAKELVYGVGGSPSRQNRPSRQWPNSATSVSGFSDPSVGPVAPGEEKDSQRIQALAIGTMLYRKGSPPVNPFVALRRNPSADHSSRTAGGEAVAGAARPMERGDDAAARVLSPTRTPSKAVDPTRVHDLLPPNMKSPPTGTLRSNATYETGVDHHQDPPLSGPTGAGSAAPAAAATQRPPLANAPASGLLPLTVKSRSSLRKEYVDQFEAATGASSPAPKLPPPPNKLDATPSKTKRRSDVDPSVAGGGDHAERSVDPSVLRYSV